MRDWTGSRVQADALAVECPDCHAAIDEVCQTDHGPLTAFPAHAKRIRISQKASMT